MAVKNMSLHIQEDLDLKILQIKESIKTEYRQLHSKPWIIGFSGGKDSTLVLHLVIEALLEMPRSERVRPMHIVANDTLVESPVVQAFVDETLTNLAAAMEDLKLPCTVNRTTPKDDQTYWVNVIGRGYPSPSRMFRWCTDRLKISPTTNFIKERICESAEVILLLGVRRSESAARAASAKKYDNGQRLNRHNDIQNCFVYRPILELTVEDVWEYLMTRKAPWGGTHQQLVKLYRNAMGGECPIVIDPDAQPSCGSSSIRFGCWTCTVVEKDKSFRNQIDNGFEHLISMAEFRDWMKEVCYDPNNRMNERRNGEKGVGPLTFEARELLLSALLKLQKTVNVQLITSKEIEVIKSIWKSDRTTSVIRKTQKLLAILESQ